MSSDRNKSRDKAAKAAREGRKEPEKKEAPEPKAPAKKQSADSTTVHVDKEEMGRADALLATLEEEKGGIIRMLRINRGSILRMAVVEGLRVLEKKVEDGESLF